MLAKILKIKHILTKHNALNSFIINSNAHIGEKRAMHHHFSWYYTSQGEDFWYEINCELRTLNLHNFQFSKEDLKRPIKIKTLKE